MAAFSSKVVPVSSGSEKFRLRRRFGGETERPDQIGDFGDLALIVAGDDDRSGIELAHHVFLSAQAMACF